MSNLATIQGTKLPVTIYVCDFFELPSVTSDRFDCAWDRGSFAAINTRDRRRFVASYFYANDNPPVTDIIFVIDEVTPV